jgi:hypothetical protein
MTECRKHIATMLYALATSSMIFSETFECHHIEWTTYSVLNGFYAPIYLLKAMGHKILRVPEADSVASSCSNTSSLPFYALCGIG